MNCPEKKHILLITTGGTIASMPGGQGLEPRRSDVLERELNQLRTYYHISIQDLMCLDSSNIQPEEWVIIARAIFEAREDYDGIVVSHGTDTMAYTASMATFMLENINLPVVFTGSQLPLADFLSDAPSNLRTAFAMAASGKPGVFLAFDRKIMLGCRAVKVRASGFSAFESINSHYVGRVTAMGLELDETMLIALNERYQLLLSVLDAEPEVEITYFVPDERKSGGAYRTVSGVVKKADEFARRLTLTDGTVIPMEDVLMLDGAIFGQNE